MISYREYREPAGKTSIRIYTLVGILGVLLLGVGPWQEGAAAGPDEPHAGTTPPDPALLNIRMSAKPVEPPDHVIRETLELTGVRAARPKVGDPPRAAILEDEHRQRALILSRAEDGRVTAQLLYDLDLAARLPHLQSCTHMRRCAIDRDPVMGGLGCVAVCVLDVLQAPPSKAPPPQP